MDRYYDMTDPCRTCKAKSGEPCVNTSDGPNKGQRREFPHTAYGDRQWDASWSAGYAEGLNDLQAKVEQWFSDVSLDDLRTAEFASGIAV